MTILLQHNITVKNILACMLTSGMGGISSLETAAVVLISRHLKISFNYDQILLNGTN